MKTFCTILDDAAAESPEKPLFIFPETRWRSEEMLTYGDLASRAGAAGCRLQELTRPGDRALLLFPTGAAFWEAFLGCLATGVIAVPLKLPNFNRINDHLERVCRDCTPSVLLIDTAKAELLERRAEKHPALQGLPILTENDWRTESSDLNAHQASGAAIAFLQYTSGSTSHPKGVQISHTNLLTNAAMIRDRMEIRTGQDRNVTWLPHYHDMGLVGSYLETLFTRNTAWCLPPEDFALQPDRWLRLISEHAATVCGGPDFAYRICADQVSDDQLEGVDLTSWRVAFNGAERIRPGSMRRFVERFSKLGFREDAFFPCYGLGEATLMVTGGPAEARPVARRVSAEGLARHQILHPNDESDVTELAGSGQTHPECPVVILHPQTGEPADDDQIGHVLVAGENVTPGYFNRNDLDEDAFLELDLNGVKRRFLQTGDLGFLSAGVLYITGRSREMMVIRGRNYFPEDIEEQVWPSHESLMPGGTVVFAVDDDEQASLIVAAEVQRSAMKMDNAHEILGAIRHSIVDAFGISPQQILLLRPASIPRTTSGKPRRLLVRSRYFEAALPCLERG